MGINTVLYANTKLGELPPPLLLIDWCRSKARNWSWFLALSCWNHLLCTIGVIYQQNYSQLKVSFYECLQDDQLRVCLSLWCWHRADELKNRKWICEVKKALTARPIWAGNWMTVRNLSVVTWLRSQTQEERGDNLLTGSRSLSFWASSRTRSVSSCFSDCWGRQC